jgi:hypothetical protein
MDIVLFLLFVSSVCVSADATVNRDCGNHHWWGATYAALPVGLLLGLYYWYARIDLRKGSGVGPEHIRLLMQSVVMIW